MGKQKPSAADTRETAVTVLICEDEDVLRELMKVALGPRFAVIEAADGPTALEVALRERPDVMLVDLMLPGITGVDLIRTLRGDPATAEIAIVVVSAWREAEQEALAAGADRFVAKPFDPGELLATVEEVVS
jgi:CheY-like chemotaxis protein